MTEKIRAWHFCEAPGEDGMVRTRYSGAPVVVGEAMTVDGPLELCARGLHASRLAIDALGYAPGPVACLVELSGEIVEGDDKLCARTRTVVAMADASAVLREFACWCAERALMREREAGREPDPRSWAAVAAARAFLRGEISAEALAHAAYAAYAADDAASADAAAHAAYAATYAAAAHAAHAASAAASDAYAAYYAAAYAAAAAARAASYAADASDDVADAAAAKEEERGAQNEQLERVLRALLGEGRTNE